MWIEILRWAKTLLYHPIRETRRWWYRCRHARQKPHDIVCHRAGSVLKFRSNSVLSESIYVGSGFEDAENTLLRSLAAPGMLAMDIGANMGLYTVLLGKAVGASGHVWSFEPFQPIVNYLKENIQLNGLTNISVVEQAASDQNGRMAFHVFADGCDVYNSLGAMERPAEDLRSVKKISVSVTTLDAYADRIGIESIDVLKVDVEGAEEKVVRGAERLIKRSSNAHIMLEMYEPSATQCGCSSQRLAAVLLDWGFLMFEVGRDGGLSPCRPDTLSRPYALFKRK